MKLSAPSRAAGTLSLGIMLLLGTSMFAQQFAEPAADDATTARRVAQAISTLHISRTTIDDRISEMLLARYLKVLDPQKQYFLKSDVEALQSFKHRLDDLVLQGDVQFAYDTFDLLLKRLDRQIELAHQLIDRDHDFTVDESITVDADKQDWATNLEELDERWRKKIKFDVVSLKIDGTELVEARDRLHKRYRMIDRTMHETEHNEKLELYLSALAHCFDPHSSYMSPQSVEEFRIAMQLSLDGIGAALRSEDGYTIVAEIVPGGAADKDGRLKAGDKIIGVGQEEGELVDIVEMKLSKVVRQIRGPRDTKVRLQVKREGDDQVVVYELTRQKIELKNAEVKGEIINTSERIAARSARIGIIQIPSFYRDFSGAQQGTENFKSTARDVLKVLKDFRDQGGVDGIVIDLRMNGGGALNEAIDVSGLFIKDGPVVQVKEQDGDVKALDDTDPEVFYTGPLVVVCNRLSASASEIFAGVIKDYQRGLIVGDTTTHGKGTVQNVMPVSPQLLRFIAPKDRGALKLTINQFYRVNGDSTQNRGVTSDVVLPSLIDHMDLGESFLENALAFDRIPAAPHATLGMVNDVLVKQLQEKSSQRVAAEEEFQELQEDIARYKERKNRVTVSLQEDVLRAEQEEGKDPEEELDPENPDGEDAEKKEVFPDGYYNNELLWITLDYIDALKQSRTAQR